MPSCARTWRRSRRVRPNTRPPASPSAYRRKFVRLGFSAPSMNRAVHSSSPDCLMPYFRHASTPVISSPRGRPQLYAWLSSAETPAAAAARLRQASHQFQRLEDHVSGPVSPPTLTHDVVENRLFRDPACIGRTFAATVGACRHAARRTPVRADASMSEKSLILPPSHGPRRLELGTLAVRLDPA